MYNPNSPSNWSWAKAFDEMNKYVNQVELTKQTINHLHNYDGGEKLYTELTKESKDEMYNILNQIL